MADRASLEVNDRASVLRHKFTLAIPNGLDAFQPLLDVAQPFAEQVNAATDQIREDKLPQYLAQNVGPMMFRAARLAHAASLTYAQEYRAADGRFRTPSNSIDRTHDVERRARYRAMEAGASMAAIARADLADLTALVAEGNLADLAADAWQLAEGRFLEENILELTGLRPQYAAKPSFDNPLPSGIDETAAQRAADTIVDSHRKRGEIVSLHAKVIQEVATFLGSSFDMTPEQAFARIIDEAA